MERTSQPTTAMEAREQENLNYVRLLANYWATVIKTIEDGPQDGEPKITVNQVLEGDKSELEDALSKVVKNAYVSILSAIELALTDRENKEEFQNLFSKLRTKTLREGNDAIRGIKEILEDFHSLRIKEKKVLFKSPELGEE